jgi:23S rRNA (adenine2030-N6)-methyltransferase
MNYRHAFHAGNFADVWKHLVLVLCLDHLRLKEAGFRVIDAFAGVGIYDLAGDAATRSPEWREGVARVRAAAATQAPPAPVARLQEALDAALVGAGLGGDHYPGSPALIAAALRPQDRAIFCELHPDDEVALRAVLAHARGAKVERRDGWTAVRAHLPPVERRGLVLLDPPFERPGEMARLATALEGGLERFATGTFVLWHADKNRDETNRYRNQLARLGARALAADLAVATPGTMGGLVSAGLTIVNPPHTLEADLAAAGAFLVPALARGEGARVGVTRISGVW